MKKFIHQYITGKPLWVNILVALGAVFLLVVLFMASLRWITQHGVALSVPAVTGKNLYSVQPQLEAKGFEVVVQDSVYYDSLPPSVIIKQVPEADAVVKVNRTIYVTINRVIPPDIEMPNLLGFSFRNAEMTLRNLGLRLGDTTFRPDFARNSVLEQLYNGKPIAAGAKIKVGSPIGLVLGTGVGNESMPVPKLIGLTFAEAKILLEAQGISLGAVLKDPDVQEAEMGYVYKQNPQPKNEEGRPYRIRPGQLIDVWIGATKPVEDSAGTKPAVPPTTTDENQY